MKAFKNREYYNTEEGIQHSVRHWQCCIATVSVIKVTTRLREFPCELAHSDAYLKDEDDTICGAPAKNVSKLKGNPATVVPGSRQTPSVNHICQLMYQTNQR